MLLSRPSQQYNRPGRLGDTQSKQRLLNCVAAHRGRCASDCQTTWSASELGFFWQAKAVLATIVCWHGHRGQNMSCGCARQTAAPLFIPGKNLRTLLHITSRHVLYHCCTVPHQARNFIPLASYYTVCAMHDTMWEVA